MYEIKKQTKRILTVDFDNDNEYCLFIKGIAQIENLSQFPILQGIFQNEYEKIIGNNELREIYDNVSYPILTKNTYV